MGDEREKKNGSRPCGPVGEGEGDVLSISEVLEEQERLHADADAVLGDSDQYNCTYPQVRKCDELSKKKNSLNYVKIRQLTKYWSEIKIYWASYSRMKYCDAP